MTSVFPQILVLCHEFLGLFSCSFHRSLGICDHTLFIIDVGCSVYSCWASGPDSLFLLVDLLVSVGFIEFLIPPFLFSFKNLSFLTEFVFLVADFLSS